MPHNSHDPIPTGRGFEIERAEACIHSRNALGAGSREAIKEGLISAAWGLMICACLVVVAHSYAGNPGEAPPYDRSGYYHWSAGQTQGDNLDTCEEIKIRRSLIAPKIERWGGRRKVTRGLWIDEHDGRPVHEATALHCDHLVPLVEIHRSGGYRMSRREKAQIANEPLNIALTKAGWNLQKGGADLPHWYPPKPGRVCSYVKRWVAVKAAYDLESDRLETQEINRLLAACAELMYSRGRHE